MFFFLFKIHQARTCITSLWRCVFFPCTQLRYSNFSKCWSRQVTLLSVPRTKHRCLAEKQHPQKRAPWVALLRSAPALGKKHTQQGNPPRSTLPKIQISHFILKRMSNSVLFESTISTIQFQTTIRTTLAAMHIWVTGSQSMHTKKNNVKCAFLVRWSRFIVGRIQRAKM